MYNNSIFISNGCKLGMCSFQHKWASERQLYLFVLLHHDKTEYYFNSLEIRAFAVLLPSAS